MECSISDAGSGLGTKISSSLLDFSNKQGVVCFVGQFSDDSIAVACLKNQVCQVNSYISIMFCKFFYFDQKLSWKRLTLHTELGSTITTGSCEFKCVPSLNTYCCFSDLCNGYQSELGHGSSNSFKYT